METLGLIARGIVEGGAVAAFQSPASIATLRRAMAPRTRGMTPNIAWLASWVGHLQGCPMAPVIVTRVVEV